MAAEKTYEKYRRLGLCAQCGKPPLPGRSRCQRCVDISDRCEAKRRERRKAPGVCTACTAAAALPGGKRCRPCLDKATAQRRKRKSAGLCRCGGRLEAGCTTTCLACRRKASAKKRENRDRVFAAYGGYACRCCGETERGFLTIDHINGDGAAHRRKIGKSSLYYWLRKNSYPAGFRVLCMNCNWAARHGGVCPHKKNGAIMVDSSFLLWGVN